ncbi:ABC transporter ATP-binding protein [Halomarina halobia]|uniref:ABC transporter ATP-binding protein n=1 Tax=Halomarina halobia TaxID=3033386 RepID=A0ABD6AEV7_9EURY|nr:ABC transporter ATP-binding protein [Halomarina sp. PSR21]
MTDRILDVDGVSVSYGDLTVLRDVNAGVAPGSVVAIVGANGAGKTTLLRTIAGVKSPDAGTITFRGEEISGREPHQLIHRGLTYVPERHRVFPEMTVQENLRTALVPVERDRREAFEQVFELFPILRERRDQEAGTMSGGQQQMLAIAQGLVTDPTLIMLDEPTLGLAPKIVEDIRDTILAISESGVTVLLVDEKVEMAAAVSDEMYLMRKNTLTYLGERGEFEAAYNRILEETVG